MLISIIIPVYNVESYIEQCLTSIQKQTYENFEVILVNDGSTDSSLEICHSFRDADERFRVFTKPNEGQGIARNFALTKCSGELVTFIDSDDAVEIHYLENLIRPFQVSSEIDLVIGGYKKVDNQGTIFYREQYIEGELPVDKVKMRILGALPDVEDSIKGTVWNSLYRTKIIQDSAIQFPSEKEFFSEDTLFNIRYLQSLKGKVFLLASSAYLYRLNLDSTSTKYDPHKLVLINDYYDSILGIYSGNEEAKLRVSLIYLMNLKRVIFQEKKNPENKSLHAMRKNISRILKDSHVRSILNNYPILKLKNRKTLFLFILSRFRQSLIISILIWQDIGRDKRYLNP